MTLENSQIQPRKSGRPKGSRNKGPRKTALSKQSLEPLRPEVIRIYREMVSPSADKSVQRRGAKELAPFMFAKPGINVQLTGFEEFIKKIKKADED